MSRPIPSPEEQHDWQAGVMPPVRRNDPLCFIAWVSVGLAIVAFWAWMAWPLVARTGDALDAAWDAVETAGTLNGCRTLNLLPGECVAWAEGQ